MENDQAPDNNQQISLSEEITAFMPRPLLKKYMESLVSAKYQSVLIGDPIDNLVNLMRDIVTDEEVWHTILNER